jgi:hypothetical protein
MSPLLVPDTLPEYARGYLRLLDEAVTKTVRDATVTSTSYREAAALYRQTGNAWRATEADELADTIERDPRIHVASIMRAQATDGTAKHMLFVYLGLLEEQVLRAKKRAA